MNVNRRAGVGLGLIVAGAAAVRFATLGLQSYDFDEAFTVQAVHGSFGAMLHAVARTESTPPLYYAVAWLWAHVFGTGEVALRSLSALAGTAVVPAVYLLGRALSTRGAALAAAAIAATSPYLVFYSQEARAYSLFALLAVVAALCCVHALRSPSRRTFGWWAVASAAAIATHYFALFFFAGEIAALAVFGAPRRLLAWSSAVVALVAVPLLALAAHQASAGHVDWIGASSLAQRVRVTVETFALGATFQGSLPHDVLAVCALLAVPMAAAIAAAVYLLVRRARDDELRAAAIVALIVAVALVLPLAAAVARKDYFLHKNLIPAVPLLAVALALGLACRRAGALGAVGAAILVVAGLALAILSMAAPSMRRPDVRQVARRLGAPSRPRVVIFVPRWQVLFDHYQGAAEELPAGGRRVDEIDVFTTSRSLPAGTVPGAFRLERTEPGTTFTLYRFASPAPVTVRPTQLAQRTFGESGLQPIAVYQQAARG